MREIKFRGLRADGNGFVYGYLVDWRSVNGDCEIMDLSHAYEVIPESVGQFTGLTDRNGIDIFEGDILQSKMYDKCWIADFTPCDGLKLAIKHENDFEFEGIPQTHENWCFNKVKSAEVIGNIHETK